MLIVLENNMKNKKYRVLETISTLFSLSCAYITSINIFPLNLWLNLIAGILWIIWASLTDNKGIVIVNIGFMLIFIVGLLKYYSILTYLQ